MNPTIKTNNVPRDIINAHELTEKERSEFDWIDWGAIERGEDSAEFVRYRGELYPLSDFVRIVPRSNCTGFQHGVDEDSILRHWDGIRTDSFFSGIVLKYAKDDCERFDSERVIVGLYTC